MAEGLHVVYGQLGAVYVRHEFDTETAADAYAFLLAANEWKVSRKQEPHLRLVTAGAAA